MARVAIGAEEKKKLYVLGGLLAAIILVVVVLYVPHGGSKTPAPPVTTPTEGTEKTPPSGGPPSGAPPSGAPGGAGAAPDTGGGGGGNNISAASLVSVSNFRSDPFEPVPLPPPLPTPPPPPPPPGPVEIKPPSVVLEPPGASGPYNSAIPPFGISSGRSTPSSRILRELAPPRISRVADAPTAPSIVVMPGGGGEGSASRSPNKRLSGVIIGDSVRALLEIQSGDPQTPPVTRIVQPGDEVDGLRILRIERVSEGGRTVTRLFIRENGEERFVDLRAAPQAAAGEGGAAPPGRGPRAP
jgi:hypothetical protein